MNEYRGYGVYVCVCVCVCLTKTLNSRLFYQNSAIGGGGGGRTARRNQSTNASALLIGFRCAWRANGRFLTSSSFSSSFVFVTTRYRVCVI